MRRISLLLAVLALLLPLGASAKGEITRVRVCGVSHCRIVSDRTAVHTFMLAIINAAQGREAPLRSPYFTLRPERTREWPTSWPRYVYVPATRMIRLQSDRRDTPEWRWLGRRDPALKRMTRGLKPFPPAAFPG
jgi:hypothetical protein